jgi:hypothetical protein
MAESVKDVEGVMDVEMVVCELVKSAFSRHG